MARTNKPTPIDDAMEAIDAPDPTGDAIDDAIEAIDAPSGIYQIPMMTVNVQLLGRADRPAQAALPADATDIEILNLIANVLALGDQVRAQRVKTPQLVVARQMPRPS